MKYKFKIGERVKLRPVQDRFVDELEGKLATITGYSKYPEGHYDVKLDVPYNRTMYNWSVSETAIETNGLRELLRVYGSV